MENFYVIKDDQQLGPLPLEELIKMKISKDTRVRLESSKRWKKAQSVKELKEVIGDFPPQSQNINEGQEKINGQETKKNIFAKSRRRFLIRPLFFIIPFLILGGIFYMTYRQQQDKIEKYEVELKNQSLTLLRQQDHLKELDSKIKEYQEIEAFRVSEDLREEPTIIANVSRPNVSSDVQSQFDRALIDLREAKLQLNQIKKFKLFRPEREKQQQIRSQLELIRELEKEAKSLQTALNNRQGVLR